MKYLSRSLFRRFGRYIGYGVVMALFSLLVKWLGA